MLTDSGLAMEGVTVRKNWFAALAAVGLTAGVADFCHAWPQVGGAAPQPAPGQFAPGPGAYGQPQPSWTQRVMAPFQSSPQIVAPNQPTSASVERRQELDPISLGYDASPGSPQLYVAMAELSHRGGNVPQARQLYQRALQADPKNVEALLGAARMEDREGKLDVALGLYQRAAAVQPKNPTILNDLALCYARKGDLESAYRALKDTINLDSKKPLYRNNMAKVLIEMNRMDEAAWNLGCVHAPAVVQYNMGVLLCQRGRNAEATQFLSRAVAIDPAMQPARVLLTQLSPVAAPMMANNQQPIVRTAQVPATVTTPDASANSVTPTPSAAAQTPATPAATAPAAQPTTPAAAATRVSSSPIARDSATPLAAIPSRLPAIY